MVELLLDKTIIFSYLDSAMMSVLNVIVKTVSLSVSWYNDLKA